MGELFVILSNDYYGSCVKRGTFIDVIDESNISVQLGDNRIVTVGIDRVFDTYCKAQERMLEMQAESDDDIDIDNIDFDALDLEDQIIKNERREVRG